MPLLIWVRRGLERLKELIVENLKGRNTPMSQSAIHIIAKELSVCISLEIPADQI